MSQDEDIPQIVGKPRPSIGRIKELVNKIGGVPVGLTAAEWPQCRECGKHMDFLAQIDLRKPVDLSRKFRFAYIFMCHGYLNRGDGQQCRTWFGEHGSNRLVLSAFPEVSARASNLGVQVWPEFNIEIAITKTDAQRKIQDQQAIERFNKLLDNYRPGMTIELGRRDRTPETIQFGGLPIWVQEACDVRCPVCKGSTKLIAQILAEVAPLRVGYQGVWLPFGGGGVAYAFMCAAECSCDGTYLMWQTT